MQKETLEQAFVEFNRFSEQLTGAYELLQGQVARLKEELAQARSERLLYLTEKEQLAMRLRTLLDTLPGAVVVIDEDGRVQDTNPVAAIWFGKLVNGSDWHEVVRQWSVTDSQINDEWVLRDGRRLSCSQQQLGDGQGEIWLFVDVTETRNLQELASRNQRLSAMGQMAANLAHQIRTPLSAALLYVSQLKKEHIAQADRIQKADKVISCIDHIEKQVNDILLFARGGQFEMELVQVSALIDHLRQLLDPLVARQKATIRWQQVPDLYLNGNYEALSGALLNLAMNALQAKQEGVELTVEVVNDSGQVQLIVADNGPGIASSEREHLFDPFYSTKQGGTGLGLSIVKLVAEAHGGQVRLLSEAGQSCRFAICLPQLADNTIQGVGL